MLRLRDHFDGGDLDGSSNDGDGVGMMDVVAPAVNGGMDVSVDILVSTDLNCNNRKCPESEYRQGI